MSIMLLLKNRIFISICAISVFGLAVTSGCSKKCSNLDESRKYLYFGKQCLLNKDAQCAMTYYNKAIDLCSNFADAYFERGFLLHAGGFRGPAIKSYNEAINLSPNNADFYYHRGTAYAELAAQRVVSINNPVETANSEYTRKSYYRQAILDLNRAIALNPNYAKAYYNRGLAHGNEGDRDRAIADYDKAIEIDPYFADAYTNRGFLYANKGDREHAIVDYNRAIEIDINQKNAYMNRAIYWFEKKDYNKAWADIETYKQSGGIPSSKFIDELSKASGKQEQERKGDSLIRPEKKGSDGFTIQTASYDYLPAANEAVARLQTNGIMASISETTISNRGNWYRVQIGTFTTQKAANDYGAELKSKGIIKGFVVTKRQKNLRGR